MRRDDARATTRDRFARRIDALGIRKAKQYAAFVRAGDSKGPLPCWGGITERFLETFPGDEERLELLDALVELGDRRPLLLFIATNRERPRVLEALAARAESLHVDAQRALVSMPEAASFVEARIETFSASAQALFEDGEDRKRAELEQLEARVRVLTAVPYFVPDSVDPASERRAGSASERGGAE